MRGAGKRTNRKGVFIGAYIPAELKESLQRRARADHRTLSQEITKILTEALYGVELPPGSPERHELGPALRRRDEDPWERRRINDLPVSSSEQGDKQ